MTDEILYILQLILAANLIIGLVWLGQRLFWKSTGHLWRKWLWLFLCLRMLFPFELQFNNFQERWTGIQLEIEMSSSKVPDAVTESASVFEPQKSENESEVEAVQVYEPVDSGEAGAAFGKAEAIGTVQKAETKKRENPGFRFDMREILTFLKSHILTIGLGIWVFGFAAILMYHVFQYFYVKEIYLNDAVECENEELLRMEVFWGDKYKLRKLPRLMEKINVGTPLVFGYRNPVVVFPVGAYSAEELSLIMQHELMHQKHRDTWYKLAVLFVCDLYWFNPFFWLMKRMAFEDVEFVCDENVIKGMTKEKIQSYGEVILKTMKISRGYPISSALQFAVNKKVIKVRLSNLFEMKNQKRGIIFFIAVLGVFMLCTVGIRVSISSAPGAIEVTKEKEYDENHFYNQAVQYDGEYIYYSTKDGIYRTKDCEEYEQIYRFLYPTDTNLCIRGNQLYFAECRNETSVVEREKGKMYQPDTLLGMNLETLTVEEYATGIDMLDRIRIYDDQLYFADGTRGFIGYELDKNGKPKSKISVSDNEFPLEDEEYCRMVLENYELPPMELGDQCIFLTYNQEFLFFAIYQSEREIGTTTILQISQKDGTAREIYKSKGRGYFVEDPKAAAFERYLYLQIGDSQILQIDIKNRSQKILEGGIPSKEEVTGMREASLNGMTEKDIDQLKAVIRNARKRLFEKYYYDDLFGKLEDPKSPYWNYLEEKGEISIGNNTAAYNAFNGEDFITVIEELKERTKSEFLYKNLELLQADMKAALESHNVLYVEDLYRRIHDMDYYLLRYGPEDGWISGIDNYDLFIYYGTLEDYGV